MKPARYHFSTPLQKFPAATPSEPNRRDFRRDSFYSLVKSPAGGVHRRLGFGGEKTLSRLEFSKNCGGSLPNAIRSASRPCNYAAIPPRFLKEESNMKPKIKE